MNKIVKLGDICDLQNGFAFKSSDYVEKSNTLNIRMSNIRPDGNFNEMHKVRYLPDSYNEKYKEFLLKENDLIIAMTDMAGDPKILGLPTLVKNLNGRKFLLNQRVGKLHKFSKEIYVPYLCYFLRTLKEYFKRKGEGGLQINISKNDILSANIILKPIVEQKQIVAKLDAAFLEINKVIKATEKGKELSKVSLSNIIDAQTSLKQNWKKYKLSDLGTVQTGGTPKKLNKKNYGDYIPFVKPPHFRTNGTIEIAKEGLSREGVRFSRKVSTNSVMMVCIGATIGKVAINHKDVCFNQQINSLTPTKEYDAELIYWQMRGSRFQAEIKKKAGQATLPIINKSKWQSIDIFLPENLKEQINIRTKLRMLSDEIDSYIKVKSQKLIELNKLISIILVNELQTKELA